MAYAWLRPFGRPAYRVTPVNEHGFRVWIGGNELSNESNNHMLRSAATAGDVELVKDLVRLKVDPNVADGKGLTALHLAAATTVVDDPVKARIVTLLLSIGADVDARSDAGELPLHIAAKMSTPATVRALLEGRADANAREGATGNTPMHLACHDLRNALHLSDAIEAAAAQRAEQTAADSVALAEQSTEREGPSKGPKLPQLPSKAAAYAAHAEQQLPPSVDIVGLVLLLLDHKADPDHPNAAGVLAPRWTREVYAKARAMQCLASTLRDFATERARAECAELDLAEAEAKKKGKGGKKGKKGGKKGGKKKKK